MKMRGMDNDDDDDDDVTCVAQIDMVSE